MPWSFRRVALGAADAPDVPTLSLNPEPGQTAALLTANGRPVIDSGGQLLGTAIVSGSLGGFSQAETYVTADLALQHACDGSAWHPAFSWDTAIEDGADWLQSDGTIVSPSLYVFWLELSAQGTPTDGSALVHTVLPFNIARDVWRLDELGVAIRQSETAALQAGDVPVGPMDLRVTLPSDATTTIVANASIQRLLH